MRSDGLAVALDPPHLNIPYLGVSHKWPRLGIEPQRSLREYTRTCPITYDVHTAIDRSFSEFLRPIACSQIGPAIY